jgi:hypothetical protein
MPDNGLLEVRGCNHHQLRLEAHNTNVLERVVGQPLEAVLGTAPTPTERTGPLPQSADTFISSESRPNA